jgi:hypothetical protein
MNGSEANHPVHPLHVLESKPVVCNPRDLQFFLPHTRLLLHNSGAWLPIVRMSFGMCRTLIEPLRVWLSLLSYSPFENVILQTKQLVDW